ncbi:MAG: MBOAT family protein [Pseudomonadota bacterium]
MLFNSIDFAVFLVVVFSLYSITSSQRLKIVILLFSSLFFYAYWSAPHLLLVFISTFSVAWLGLRISSNSDERRRKLYVSAGVALNLGILAVFKYFNFFVEVLSDMGSGYSFELSIALPLGISFYTFQSVSYLIDVYRRKIEAEQNPISVLLYVAFFPQLVAGPIVRASEFLPQLKVAKRFNHDDLVWGFNRIVCGLLKKVVIADNIAVLVDPVYANPTAYSSGALLLATYAFAVQIFCDFSGYSDIAIGVARIFGYRLNENFNVPYISKSITEFWRRWHISLSSWLKDYLYIPLGGNRNGVVKTYRNLLITMLLGGLWHGASYNFIIWGALHGSWLAIERWCGNHLSPRKYKSEVSHQFVKALKVVLVFHGVCVTWVFFRAATLEDALAILYGIVSLSPGSSQAPFQIVWQLGLLLLVSTFFTLFRFVALASWSWVILLSSAVTSVVLFGASSSQFIYFVF